MSRDPIWARPEPPGRGGLSRAEIVRVALKLADEEGIEAVSMRRLARELGSGAMSLYHYFESRDELLELLGETVTAEVLLPGDVPADWRAALKEIALRSRAAWLRHPWLLAAVQERRTAITPNMLRHVEQSSRAVLGLAEQGVPREQLSRLVVAVDDYTVGYTVREAAARGRNMGERMRDVAGQPHIRYLLESGEFPMLEQFLAGDHEVEEGDHFEAGLDWLLDGFAAQLGR